MTAEIVIGEVFFLRGDSMLMSLPGDLWLETEGGCPLLPVWAFAYSYATNTHGQARVEIQD